MLSKSSFVGMNEYVATEESKSKKSFVVELKKVFSYVFPQDENFSLKEMDTIYMEKNKNVKFDSETIIMFKEIKSLEKIEEELVKEMSEMKTNELKRINKEFLTNNYSRRFNVTQECVISALVGEHSRNWFWYCRKN